MKIKFVFLSLVLAIGLTSLLAACEKEGPAEKAGQQIDQAVDEVKEEAAQIKESGEDTLNK
ncbi:MAG: hypothetical protein A2X84_01800 [Desulfuromonadaceae bacterium GWC2_58_13]|nr:MAG: hypothetical protein A2X84_01800 [Desulfuromonadaceae bacterium GWC2_58_13]